MNDNTSVISSLINVKEDIVEYVSTSSDMSTVTIKIKRNTLSCCPLCDSSHLKSKGYVTKLVKVSNQLFDSSNIYVSQPRYLCLDCNHSFLYQIPLSPKRNNISYQVVLKVMDLLKSPTVTFSEAAKLAGISPQSVLRIFDRYCHMPTVAFPEVICIDEVYTKNNDFKSKYSCIIYDFYRRKIVDVLPSRQKDYLISYFYSMKTNGKALSVKYVCIDMYSTYRDIAKTYLKKAIICVDSFHVIKLLNDCLNNLRISLMKKYSTKSQEYYLLKKWKNLLFTENLDINQPGKYNRMFNRILNYNGLLELMLDISNDLRLAYNLKNIYMRFNRDSTYEQAVNGFGTIYDAFLEANIKEFEPFTTALKNWRNEIINSFIRYNGKRINSSVAEGINARVAQIIYNSRGIRNHERRKKRIMYCINGNGFLRP